MCKNKMFLLVLLAANQAHAADLPQYVLTIPHQCSQTLSGSPMPLNLYLDAIDIFKHKYGILPGDMSETDTKKWGFAKSGNANGKIDSDEEANACEQLIESGFVKRAQ